MSAAREDPRPQVFTDKRPWGAFEQYTLNEPSTVKTITVEPGHRLSLQTHTQRDELWTVLDSEALVDIGGRSWQAQPGEKVWIPRGTPHRLANPGSSPVRILEVAFGTFDEADIVRLSDDYPR